VLRCVRAARLLTAQISGTKKISMSPTSVPIFQRLLPRETHGPTAQLFDLTVSFECTLKQPLFSQITIGNVLCSGAAAAGPSRAIDVVWNVAELDRGNRPGHTVRLMAPQFVKPYVKTNKSDVADAEAICEAVSRPNMRFVPIKTVEQQAILSVHRVRQGFVKARTAQADQIRGLLGEFGLVVPQGIINVTKRIPEILEDASNESPGTAAANSAASSKRSQVSAHWRQLHWSHRSRMRTALTTAGKSPRGLA
jgi:hypothetical protein